MIPIHIPGAVADHLWQSTIFAAVVALLALTMRRNRAEVRYRLWLAASLKFLVPFAALTAVGRQFGWVGHETVRPSDLPRLVEAIGQPFTAPGTAETAAIVTAASAGSDAWTAALAAIWVGGAVAFVVSWRIRWRQVSAAVSESSIVDGGDVHESLRRIEQRVGIARPTALASSDRSLEPGVFGIWRPLLLWPRGIEAHLDRPQIEAILAHEVAHVRRRDNLTSALHMVVEALFWFHPLVWWIGGRLVHERERACDEEVVRLGTKPHVYAESVIRTCRFSIESPLPCVAGVTGSNLRKRIELIMTDDATIGLTVAKRLVLAGAAVAATIGPVAFGVLTAPSLVAQVVAPGPDAPLFEAASVRPNNTGGMMGGRSTPGRFVGTNLPLKRLIRQAYDIHDSQIVGGPDWIESQGFDINATTGDKPPDQMRFMMQTLLRDRFMLTFHVEKRELPVYALVVARSDGRLGPGLRRIADDECPPPGARRGAPPPAPPPAPRPSPFDPGAQAPCGSIIFGPGRLLAHGVPIDMLARSIANLPAIMAFNRIVHDETGLEGQYGFDLRWTNEFGAGRGTPPPAGPPPAPGDEPALVTALQEQLGLKLDVRRTIVDVLVIDSVEKPSED